MKKIVILAGILIGTVNAFGQKYLTQNGTINFYSETPLENIESVNNQVSSVLDTENGNIVFSLLIKAFSFEKALMQEHFNEKYLESEKYPKSTFKGSILDYSTYELSNEPTKVKIKGQLTIHGVTKEIEVNGSLTKTSDSKIKGESEFLVLLDDYNIKVPSAVSGNIAKEIKIKAIMNYEKFEK
ncbi:MAG: YceI family protein [Bacteroidetes bacterium]|nr:MAG: YceI family protein [Bacteroidota bacterium]MBL1143944.1 YceI family protein [Bacteroidota bacterium]MCB0802383.1 YceI family protein [Flavobacteriales bacterium]NOG56745.1 YceI family protein [Bacteroidota bacterium]